MTIPPGSTNSLNPEQQISSSQREDQTSEDTSRVRDFDDINYRSPTVHNRPPTLPPSFPGSESSVLIRQDNPIALYQFPPIIPPSPRPQIEIDIPES